MKHSFTARVRRGFTLIEVLIVVAIIGLAGALVVPQMLDAGSMGVQAATRIVIADLLFAQNESMARQSPRKVIFDPEENAYFVTDKDNVPLTASWKGGGDQNYQIDFDKDDRFRGVEITSVDIGGDQTLVFNDLGAPDSGGTIDLVHENDHLRITIAAFTGRVTVERVEP